MPWVVRVAAGPEAVRLAPGTIFSLLGPNGAGKTTVIRILSTLIRADAGECRIGGHDVAADPDAVRASSASPVSSPR